MLTPATSCNALIEDKKATADDITMRMLAPNLHYDFRVIAETEGKINDLKDIAAQVMLLGGSKSPAYLKTALDALEKVLPHAERREFAGLDHSASGNADRRARPEIVAADLRRFFAGM